MEKVESQLKSYYLTQETTRDEDIIISFLIGGAMHAVMNTKYNEKEVINTLASFLTILHDEIIEYFAPRK
jgi:hypothetical protein